MTLHAVKYGTTPIKSIYFYFQVVKVGENIGGVRKQDTPGTPLHRGFRSNAQLYVLPDLAETKNLMKTDPNLRDENNAFPQKRLEDEAESLGRELVSETYINFKFLLSSL